MYIALTSFITLVVGRLYVWRRGSRLVEVKATHIDADVAAVLGAGLRADGTPTGLLARRVEAAVALYEAGSIDRLLMSGDADAGGDQPLAMAEYAILLGIPEERIGLDRHGIDTAATCRTVRSIYGQAPVVFVTQRFHAHRTAYLAIKAGLNATVFAAPDNEIRPRVLRRAKIREVPAAWKAIVIDRFQS